jgi:hypothetical protein
VAALWLRVWGKILSRGAGMFLLETGQLGRRGGARLIRGKSGEACASTGKARGIATIAYTPSAGSITHLTPPWVVTLDKFSSKIWHEGGTIYKRAAKYDKKPLRLGRFCGQLWENRVDC